MKIRICFAVACLALCSTLSSCLSDKQNHPQSTFHISDETVQHDVASRKIVSSYSDFLAQHGLPVLYPTNGLPMTTKNDRNYGKEIVVTGNGMTPYEISLLKDSGEFVSLANWDAHRSSYGVAAKRYPSPPSATWSKEKAIEMARKVVAAILGTFPKHTKLAVAEYQARPELPEYYIGNWYVAWHRTDGQGHTYSFDSITVQLSEEDGPYYVKKNYCSEYRAGREAPRFSTDVYSNASISARNIILQPVICRVFGDNLLIGQPGLYGCMIVVSNTLQQLHDIEELGLPPQGREARLAWVIGYDIVGQDGEFKTTNGCLRVWIDTETGDCLGGELRSRR